MQGLDSYVFLSGGVRGASMIKNKKAPSLSKGRSLDSVLPPDVYSQLALTASLSTCRKINKPLSSRQILRHDNVCRIRRSLLSRKNLCRFRPFGAKLRDVFISCFPCASHPPAAFCMLVQNTTFSRHSHFMKLSLL